MTSDHVQLVDFQILNPKPYDRVISGLELGYPGREGTFALTFNSSHALSAWRPS